MRTQTPKERDAQQYKLNIAYLVKLYGIDKTHALIEANNK
jgi:hypothetical protein